MQYHYSFIRGDAGGDTLPGTAGATPANEGIDSYLAHKSQLRCSI
jgi:hypothetical protein